MNAADTSASSAIADCTPLTVVSRSWTTAEIDTFISDVSTTSTNIAIDSRIASRLLPGPAAAGASATVVTTRLHHAAPRGALVPASAAVAGRRPRRQRWCGTSTLSIGGAPSSGWLRNQRA